MTTPTEPRISFVIAVKDDARRLERCLGSIALGMADDIAAEIIVVDNGSIDDSPAVARRAGARVLVLPGLTVAELRNRGAAAASGDAIAFVDADHEIVQAWIRDGLDALTGDRVGAAGALYTPPRHGTWVQRLYGRLRGTTTGRSDTRWLGSGNLIVRREAFEAIGGFDVSLAACEDVDFCRRLRIAGWRLIADERLVSVHHGDPATLGALFRAERWRGRDNLRVSLRRPVALGDLPSALIPIAEMLLTLTAIVGLAASPFISHAWVVAAGCAAAVAGLVGLRTARIFSRLSRLGRLPRPAAIDFLRACLVAGTYDAARAIALVTRAPHHRRAASGPTAARTPAA
jgi:GT2 family glycosyltransferase